MRAYLLALVGLFTFVGSALADDACAADRKSFCGGAQDPRAIGACMKAHEQELSPACQAQRAAVKEVRHEIHQDCRPDLERLCPGLKTPRERFVCLQSHDAEVSAACKTHVDRAAERKAARSAGAAP